MRRHRPNRGQLQAEFILAHAELFRADRAPARSKTEQREPGLMVKAERPATEVDGSFRG